MLKFLIAITVSLVASASAYEVKPITAQQAKDYHLDRNFFKKGTMAEGIFIATSDKVSDYAHLEAAYQFGNLMSALKPEIAKRISDDKVLCILVGHNELTSDIPQFKSDKTGKELDFYNWRSRGFLTQIEETKQRIVLFAEEDVLEYEGGMLDESILIHEFGHVIHRPGFYDGLDDELFSIWEKSTKKDGLWHDGYASQRFRRVKGDEPVVLLDALKKSFPNESSDLLEKCLKNGDILLNGKPTNSTDVKVTGDDKVRIVFGGPKNCYATKNRGEYFAEIVQAWFDTNRTMDHDHNHIDTRDELKEYDPAAYKFLQKIFKEEDWRFVPTRKRAGKGHLKGYDVSKAPVVVQPDFIKDAANDYYDEYWSDYWQRLYDKYPGIVRPEQPKKEKK